MLANGLDGSGAALGFANHRQQAGLLQHQVREFVHAGGGGWARRAHHLIAHRVHGAYVVNNAITQVYAFWQRLALRIEVRNALVRSVAAREHLAVQ